MTQSRTTSYNPTCFSAGFKWENNSCALDTVCTTVAYLMFVCTDDERVIIQRCFKGGHQILRFIQGTISVSELKQTMMNLFYGRESSDGEFYASYVWEKLFL